MAFSSAYHPQTNGQTERTNQSLEQYLCCFSAFSQDDWVSLLPIAEFAYNKSVHSAIKQTPFFANYGFHPSFLTSSLPECAIPAVSETMNFFINNNKLLQETMARTQEYNKKMYDRKKRGQLLLEPGNQVWLSTSNLRMACPSRKLGPRFMGPFSVKRKINDVAYELVLPNSLKIHPVFHVSLLKPVIPNSFSGRNTGPPEPVIIDNEEEFEVEAILDCRKRRNQIQYLIKWRGYGPEDNSWEPEANLHAEELLRDFQSTHADRLARLGIRRLPLRRGHCQRGSRFRTLAGHSGVRRVALARAGARGCARLGVPARSRCLAPVALFRLLGCCARCCPIISFLFPCFLFPVYCLISL